MDRIEEGFKHGCAYQAEHITFPAILVEGNLLKENSPCGKAYGEAVDKEEEQQEEGPVQCTGNCKIY